MQVGEMNCHVLQDVAQLALLDQQGENEVAELFDVLCDIIGEAISDEVAHKWNAKEMTKLHSLGMFVQITEDESVEYWRIKTRCDIRRGARRAEDYSPAPFLTKMRACLMMTAKGGHAVSRKGRE
eukprot:6461423-Amphidinium_carterae.1